MRAHFHSTKFKESLSSGAAELSVFISYLKILRAHHTHWPFHYAYIDQAANRTRYVHLQEKHSILQRNK